MRRSALHYVLTVLNSRVVIYSTTHFVDAQKVLHLSVQCVIHQPTFLDNCIDSIASGQTKFFTRTLKRRDIVSPSMLLPAFGALVRVN